jgi:hypothetical protein
MSFQLVAMTGQEFGRGTKLLLSCYQLAGIAVASLLARLLALP